MSLDQPTELDDNRRTEDDEQLGGEIERLESLRLHDGDAVAVLGKQFGEPVRLLAFETDNDLPRFCPCLHDETVAHQSAQGGIRTTVQVLGCCVPFLEAPDFASGG